MCSKISLFYIVVTLLCLPLSLLLLLSRYVVEVGGIVFGEMRKDGGGWVMRIIGLGRLWCWVGRRGCW